MDQSMEGEEMGAGMEGTPATDTAGKVAALASRLSECVTMLEEIKAEMGGETEEPVEDDADPVAPPSGGKGYGKQKRGSLEGLLG